jgi:hypothetical protein
MIYGNLYIMNDVRNALLAAEADGCKIAVLSEEPILDLNSGFAVPGTCLLPPPMAKIAEIDGDAERFYEIYNEHLLSDVPVDFISIILGLLHQGGSMIFLINCGIDEPWVMQLCNHFMNYYGITIGRDGVLAGFNMQFSDTINNIIYVSGFISPEEYLTNKSAGFPMQPWIVEKLSAELPLRDMDNAYAYYEELCVKLKSKPDTRLAVRFRRRHV